MNCNSRLACLAFGAVSVLAAQQGFAPDELRARSGVYTLPAPTVTIRTSVDLVEVPVVVRDSKHRTVGSLTRDDFEIYANGKKQPITAFSVENFLTRQAAEAQKSAEASTAAPASAPASHPKRHIVLCLDNLNTPFADLKRIKDSAERFVKDGLAPDDTVAVVATASSQNAGFTTDPTKLVNSIEKVTPQSHFSEEGISLCPRLTSYQAYLIVNHLDNDTLNGVVDEDMACKGMRPGQRRQAVDDVNNLANLTWETALANSRNAFYAIQGVVDGLGKIPGRRMLLLASSGFLSGNLEDMEEELITRAVHAEVVINSLDAKGLYTVNAGRPIDAPPVVGASPRTQIAEAKIASRQAEAKDDALAVLAIGTGGAFYHNRNDLDRGFHELSALPGVMYVLGFPAPEASSNERYHRLKVKLAKGNHYSIQARSGYFAAKQNSAPETPVLSRLDREMTAHDTPREVAAAVTLQAGLPEENVPLMVTIRVDVSRMQFQAREDRRLQKLTFVTALLDLAGNLINGKRAELDLALRAATYERLTGTGLTVRLPLSAPPGIYTVRTLLQEGLEGKLAAFSQPVQLPLTQ